ncbi:gliding motility-associated C-terminal domain-containing protein [Lewinella sp. 4G2]|uniref:T9SS type B sorting domain-containing protein n=1 Tax=Lewinella sp. 4G2 TaxID=1803372 RepID=UPI0007B4B306|nr:gliding motility-associated C-terminal domain-containing protein [Lewinella sp. 4G2]OAV42650.1 hypothetical protein A3850_015505 [Lewinella sp. 4G2]
MQPVIRGIALALLTLHTFSLNAQCGLTLFAGNDTTICASDLPFVIENVVAEGEGLLGVQWGPEGIFRNGETLQPSFRGNRDTTVYLTALKADPADNLFLNPGFGDRFDNWESPFLTGVMPGSPVGEHGILTDAGTYTVTDSPTSVHAQLCPIRSHDANNSRLLVVNNSAQENRPIVCQTVTVEPNRDYSFGAWMANAKEDSPPVVLFAVNRTRITGDIELPATTCEWAPYTGRWSSGAATTAEVCIVNRNTETIGNDLIIDDLYFGPICEQVDSFRITIPVINVDPGEPLTLPCQVPDEGIQLDGRNSPQGPEYSYQWRTPNGNIVSGETTLQPFIDQAGDYFLEVTLDDGSGVCSRERSVNVRPFPFAPTVMIEADEPGFNCLIDEIEINSDGSGGGTFIWLAEDGGTISDNDGDEITVTTPGKYTLTIVGGGGSGCIASQSINLPGDFEEPNIDLPTEYFIGCATPEVTLDARGSAMGPNIEVEWQNFGGTNISSSTSYAPVVDRAGTYVLTLTNTQNGCDASATVRVRNFQFNPNITLSAPQVFTCDRTQIPLNSNYTNVPFGSDIGQEWTTDDGIIVSGADQANPIIGRPGTYTLTLTNRANGCTESESILVEPGIGVPVANANEDRVLNCNTTSIPLNSTGSTTGSNYETRWENASGIVITSGSVMTAGTFTLFVTNTDDGCVTEDSFTITLDNADPPTAILAPVTELTCDVLSLELSSDQSDPDFSYAWTGPAGGITTAPDASSVTVDVAGRYEVVTTNTRNGCTSTVSRNITANQTTPVVSIDAPPVVTCANPEVSLAGNITNPTGFNLRWATADGNFTGGETTLTPTVDAAGTYRLIFANPATGCADSASVVVTADQSAVVAAIDGGNQLDCNNAAITLNTTGSATGTDITYVWNRDGVEVNRFPGTESGALNVTTAGSYELLVVNTVSGCDDRTDLTVTADFAVQQAGFDDTVDSLVSCTNPAVTLRGAAVTDPAMTYSWTIDGVPLLAGPDPEFTTTGAGLYALTITNPANGCTSEDSKRVTVDTLAPVAAIAPADELNCAATTVTLAETSGGAAGVSFAWSGPGTVTPSPDGLTAAVTEPGTYRLDVANSINGCSASTTVEVTRDVAEPTAEAGDGFTLSCGATSSALDGAGSSTGADFTYAWSGPSILTGGSTLAPEVSGAGKYFLTVQNNGNQCTSVDSVEVLADFNAPQLDLARTQVLNCLVAEVSLEPTSSLNANWTYEWTEDADPATILGTTSTLEVMTAGEYKLTTLDPGSGCSTVSPVTVTADRENPVAGILPADAILCTRPSVTLDGSPSTTTRPANLRWTQPANGTAVLGSAATLNTSQAGTFQLFIEYPDNGCVDSTTVTVAIDTITPTAELLTAGGLDCQFTSVDLLTDPASRSTDYAYQWTLAGGTLTGPDNGPEISTDQAGTYQLLVSNNVNGCTQNLSATVAVDTVKPFLSTLPDGLLTCSAGGAMTTVAVLNGRPDIQFNWTTTNGAFNGATNEATVAAAAPGNYTVLAADPNNGCTSTTSWLVNEDREIPTLQLPDSPDLGCENEPTTLVATLSAGTFSYDWTSADGNIVNGNGTPNVLVDLPGTYSLTATNLINDCPASASVTVTGNDLADFDFQLVPANCVNPLATLTFQNVDGGIGPYLFSTDGGETFGPGGSPLELEPGTYSFGVQDSRGCEAVQEVRIDSARLLEANIANFITINLGDSTRLDLRTNFSDLEIDTVIWSPAEGLSCTDCLRPTARPFRSVNYIAEVRTADGCTDIVEVTVEVDRRLTAYFPTAFSPNNDGRNDLFHPFADRNLVQRVKDFRVHDRWGNAVYEAAEIVPNDIRVGWDGLFRGKQANSGVYIYSAVVEFFGGQNVVFEGEVILMR